VAANPQRAVGEDSDERYWPPAEICPTWSAGVFIPSCGVPCNRGEATGSVGETPA